MTGAQPRRRSWPSTRPRPGSSSPSAPPAGDALDARRAGRPATATARRCCRRSSGLLERARAARARDLPAIVVGTGPGRLHRASGRASRRPRAWPTAWACPIVGVSTARRAPGRRARPRASADAVSCCCPPGRRTGSSCATATAAGPAAGRPGPGPRAGATSLVAVDLDGRAPADALERGERRPRRPGRALLRARGGPPRRRRRRRPRRGSCPNTSRCRAASRPPSGEVAWSRDPR